MAHEAIIIATAPLVTTLAFIHVAGAVLIFTPAFYIHIRQS